MARIKTIEELREAIRDLEHQNYVNEQHMRGRVTELTERLKPANVVKGLFSHFFSGGNEMKTSLLKMAAGIATSFLVKKFFKKGLAVK
ncbi:hypothetical protein [Puia sp.]|jgi:hypothetical protein|uniref:hypothetical protein n=1 Tax=Puia sp. TaxID=2045100 RepID=UPI002F3FF610